jgi:alpha-beta hydrolase superfamily lysophospholipase
MSTGIPSSKTEQLQNMADTVWAMERDRREQELPLPERINLLRTHYELQRVKEEELDIPKRDRSFLYLQEEPTATVLLVPGGHSTPAQYFHLGRHLYRSGMTVYSSLLPNEAAVGAQQGGVPWQLSLGELEMRYELLAMLGAPVHVVGSSFGGILGVLLADGHPVRSLTLLSPPLKPTLGLKERMALTWSRLFPRLFERMIAASPHRWMADRYGALRRARRCLSSLEAPLLAIHAMDNAEVSPEALKVLRRARGDGATEVELLERGGHLLLEGQSASQVQQRVLDFIQRRQAETAPRAEAAPQAEATARD